jgi:hypothetical protein
MEDVAPAAASAARPPVWLVLDEVKDPQNFGALLRSALFLGCGGVVACAKNSASLSPAVSKSSAGALELMPVWSLAPGNPYHIMRVACHPAQVGGRGLVGARSPSARQSEILSRQNLAPACARLCVRARPRGEHAQLRGAGGFRDRPRHRGFGPLMK